MSCKKLVQKKKSDYEMSIIILQKLQMVSFHFYPALIPKQILFQILIWHMWPLTFPLGSTPDKRPRFISENPNTNPFQIMEGNQYLSGDDMVWSWNELWGYHGTKRNWLMASIILKRWWCYLLSHHHCFFLSG